MKRSILLYGLAVALGATLLQWLEYRHLVRMTSTPIYVAAISLFFIVLGVWTGYRLAPGSDTDARELDSYTDVRELQEELRSRGIEFAEEADEESTGPASFVIVDPDGNPILVDQHV